MKKGPTKLRTCPRREKKLVDKKEKKVSDTTHIQDVLSHMEAMHAETTFTDVTIKSGSVEIPCHKLVLAAASPYLMEVFQASAQVFSANSESSDNKDEEEDKPEIVHLDFIEPDTLVSIIKYMYTSTIDISNNNVISILVASDRLKLNRLKEKCGNFMIPLLTPGNCIGYYKIGKKNTHAQLAEASRDVMLSKLKEVTETQEFLRMDITQLMEYMCDDCLDVKTEDSVLQAALKWIKHDNSRMQHAELLMSKCVRLCYCSPEMLQQTFSEHNFLASSPACASIFAKATLLAQTPLIDHKCSCECVKAEAP